MKDKDLGLIFELFTEIGIISQLSNTLLEKYLPLGLKSSQFALMNHLIRVGGGETHAQLASTMQVTKGAMTNTLNRLKFHDLIRIEQDSIDGRIKRVYITEKGSEIREESITSLSSSMLVLKKDIGLNHFEDVLPFLSSLRKILDSKR
ncbi:MAG: MarR family transcriptional regulator [Kangiella sp.]|nr:MAG: MarR family transcriptional regulator [Kangiella sp.]